MSFDAFIPLHDFLRIDGQLLVRVHHHAEEARVSLRKKREEINKLNLGMLNETNSFTSKTFC